MSAEQEAVMDDLRQQAGTQAGSEAKQGEYIPRDEAAAKGAGEATTAQVLEMLFVPLFKFGAPAWEVSPEEIQALAEVDGETLDAWFPDGFLNSKYGLLISMAAVNFAILGPRLRQPRFYPEPEPITDPAPDNVP